MIIPDGFLQVNLEFDGGNLPHGAEVTFGCELDSFSGSASVAASTIGDIFEATGDLWASTSVGVTFRKCRVKYGPNDTGASGEAAYDTDGTYSSSDNFPAACYLIRKNTALGGRQGRGRLYWPGAVLQDIDAAGFLASNLVNDQNDGWSTVQSELLGAGFVPVLLRAADSPIQLPASITSWSCQAQAATQRRRLRR